jgi:hypothetical protein
MKVIMRAAILLVLIIGYASANPVIPSPISYTVSEDLNIALDEYNASISGSLDFHFIFGLQTRPIVQIPVWLPAKAETAQTNLIAFLDALSFEGSETFIIDAEYRSLIDGAIGMHVEADGVALKSVWLQALDYEELMHTALYPASYWRAGVVEAKLVVPVEPEVVSDMEMHLTVQYRQPLIKTGGRTLLFYVPLFDRMWASSDDRTSNDYYITVQCPEGFKLVPRSQFSYHEPPNATTLIIAPKDSEIILVELVKEGQDISASPLDPGWLTVPKKQHGDSACRCKGKSDLHLQAIYWTSNNPLAIITIDGKQMISDR